MAAAMALDDRPSSDDDDASLGVSAESAAGSPHDGDGGSSSDSEGNEDDATTSSRTNSDGESSDTDGEIEDGAPQALSPLKPEPADDMVAPQRPVQWQLKRGTPQTQPPSCARPVLTYSLPFFALGMPADTDSVARATALLRYQLDLELLLKRNELQTIKSRIAQAEELSRALRAAILQCACGGL